MLSVSLKPAALSIVAREQRHQQRSRAGTKGCAAAAEYAQIHWAKLQRLVNDDAVPAASIELHGNDRRLYACFRASISEDVAVLRAEQLKTRIWRDLLTCMDGRVKDHNFMTLLRPDASLSYDDQRDSLFVVPRAQFLMIELARQAGGVLRRRLAGEATRARDAGTRGPLRLARTARYSVLAAVRGERPGRGERDPPKERPKEPRPSRTTPAPQGWASSSRSASRAPRRRVGCPGRGRRRGGRATAPRRRRRRAGSSRRAPPGLRRRIGLLRRRRGP